MIFFKLLQLFASVVPNNVPKIQDVPVTSFLINDIGSLKTMGLSPKDVEESNFDVYCKVLTDPKFNSAGICTQYGTVAVRFDNLTYYEDSSKRAVPGEDPLNFTIPSVVRNDTGFYNITTLYDECFNECDIHEEITINSNITTFNYLDDNSVDQKGTFYDNLFTKVTVNADIQNIKDPIFSFDSEYDRTNTDFTFNGEVSNTQHLFSNCDIGTIQFNAPVSNNTYFLDNSNYIQHLRINSNINEPDANSLNLYHQDTDDEDYSYSIDVEYDTTSINNPNLFNSLGINDIYFQSFIAPNIVGTINLNSNNTTVWINHGATGYDKFNNLIKETGTFIGPKKLSARQGEPDTKYYNPGAYICTPNKDLFSTISNVGEDYGIYGLSKAPSFIYLSYIADVPVIRWSQPNTKGNITFYVILYGSVNSDERVSYSVDMSIAYPYHSWDTTAGNMALAMVVTLVTLMLSSFFTKLYFQKKGRKSKK